jgi:uncharacterized protein YbaA (DUF1428 family)
MTYVQGFVTPAPAAKRQAYLDHARQAAPLMKEFGAVRHVEAWGDDDVPEGKVTDFHRAVLREPDEAVVFSWLEYPDRAACDAASERMMSDPRMAELGDLPFDAGRIIYGGFEVILDEGPGGASGYVDGIVLPVRTDGKDAYVAFARAVAASFLENGATRLVECWGEDVPHGARTDFHRAVLAEEGETVVFSWIAWPGKATRDAGMAAARADTRMTASAADVPMDGRRMIFGGFTPILDTEGE